MGLKLPGGLQSLFAMEVRKFLLVGPEFLPHAKATHVIVVQIKNVVVAAPFED
jgi:hypothetical protein